MAPATAAAIQAGDNPKGEVLATARLAGIQAAKQTGLLIPLAHPLTLTFVDVGATVDVAAGDRGAARRGAHRGPHRRRGWRSDDGLRFLVAALTVYDIVKGLERGVEIAQVVLLEKTGGRSDWLRARPGTSRAEGWSSWARRSSESAPPARRPAGPTRAVDRLAERSCRASGSASSRKDAI